jgi:hypothetical protein
MKEKDPFAGFVDIIDSSVDANNFNNGNNNGNGNSNGNGNGNNNNDKLSSATLNGGGGGLHHSNNNNNSNNNDSDSEANEQYSDNEMNNGSADANTNGDVSDEATLQKMYECLSIDQQQLLKAKLPLLADATQLEKRNEILIKKLTLCATTFDFTAPV